MLINVGAFGAVSSTPASPRAAGEQSSPSGTDWDRARQICIDAATVRGAETMSLADSIGLQLAEDVRALCDVPHYSSSAMDGWAVRGEAPWLLVSVGPLRAGEASPIVTGGLVPEGADGVLRSEHATVVTTAPQLPGESVRSLIIRNALATVDEPSPGQHVRPAGEEARNGEMLVRAGRRVSPMDVAVAASAGHNTLKVIPRARVAVILSGSEVVESGIPHPGKVRDSFGPQLPAVIEQFGGIVVHSARIDDRMDDFVSALSPDNPGTGNADIVVTTGGTGTSEVDYLHRALAAVGATLLFDGIAVRPGGPTLLARLADGRLVLGLPGNPLAAMMGVIGLLGPLLAASGRVPIPGLRTVELADDMDSRRGVTTLSSVTLTDGRASRTRWTGSGMMRGLASADGVVVCPPGGHRPGDLVQLIELPWRALGAPH